MSDSEDTRVSVCPICSVTILHLGKHLSGMHRVKNKQERTILTRLGNKTLSIRLCPCPVVGCSYQSGRHLDRHLKKFHTEMSDSEKGRMADHARTLLALKQLAILRSSDPDPPMASTMDLEDPPHPKLQLVDTPTQPTPAIQPTPAGCACQECSYREEVERLNAVNLQLMSRVKELTEALTKAKRVAAGLRRGPSLLRAPVLHPVKRRRSRAAAGGEEEEEEQEQEQREEADDDAREPAISGTPELSPPSDDPPSKSRRSTQVSAVQAEDRERGGAEQEEILIRPRKKDLLADPKASGTTPASTSGVWSRGSGKGNAMHRLVLPPSMERYLKNFREYCTHRYGTLKMAESVTSKISRIKCFLHYMARGHTRLSDWKFLYNISLVDSWIKELFDSRREPTTVRYYIHNVCQLLVYIQKYPPTNYRLTRNQTVGLLEYLTKARKDTSRLIGVHQSRVKRAKKSQVPDRQSILTCIR